jgi:hypothetical protein
MKNKTPEQIIDTTVAHFGLNRERLMAIKRMEARDHAEGYGLAWLIIQALCAHMTGLTMYKLAGILPRTQQSIQRARNKIDMECRTNPKVRDDVMAIIKAL